METTRLSRIGIDAILIGNLVSLLVIPVIRVYSGSDVYDIAISLCIPQGLALCSSTLIAIGWHGRLQWQWCFRFCFIIWALFSALAISGGIPGVLIFSAVRLLLVALSIAILYLYFMIRILPERERVLKAYQYLNSSVQTSTSVYKFLAEEHIGDLRASQKRWRRQGLSKSVIKKKTLWTVIDMLWGVLKCHIQNIWLDNITLE